MQKCTLATYSTTTCVYIAHSMPVVVVAWVSIVQSGYFCITLHFIGLCEGWYSRFPWLSCDCSFYYKGTI